jgi:hypothetical protein
MSWVGQVACQECEILIGRDKLFESSRRRWKGDIKIDFGEFGKWCRLKLYMAQNSVHCWAVVNMAKNLWLS